MFYLENYDHALDRPYRNTWRGLRRTFVSNFFTDKITSNYLYPGHLWFVDTFHVHRGHCDRIDKIAAYIKQREQQQLTSGLVFDYSFEYLIDLNWFCDYISQLKASNIDFNKIYFVFNTAARSAIESALPDNLNIHYIDYFAVSELKNVENGTNKISTRPLAQRDVNLNILAARIFEKRSRLDGLYLLWQRGLAQQGITSVLITDEVLAKHAGTITDQDFYRWLENNLGPVDDIDIRVVQDSISGTSLFTNGMPYNGETYDKSRVSYVFESYWPDRQYPRDFLTEKIYRPIINKSPFVLQGNPESLNYLKEQGFNVYDNFVGNYYENNSDYPAYIVQTVAAAQNLLAATVSHTAEMERAAQYNYDRFIQLAQTEFGSLTKFLDI